MSVDYIAFSAVVLLLAAIAGAILHFLRSNANGAGRAFPDPDFERGRLRVYANEPEGVWFERGLIKVELDKDGVYEFASPRNAVYQIVGPVLVALALLLAYAPFADDTLARACAILNARFCP